MPILSALCTAFLLATAAAHGPPLKRTTWHMPGRNLVQTSTFTPHFFNQQLDHQDPEAGTFAQRYWYNTEYWNGPGSPVVLFTPGEEDASEYLGYLTAQTLTGLIAQRIGAATILLEHRYWGASSPFSDLTTANLTYLNLENNILDLTNFAASVELPFASESASSNADAVPWVLVGGSYSGALTAWTEALAPGTFWAYLATSAPVEAISDYWQYFVPVQQGMPRNCSNDVARVVDYLDGVMSKGTPQAKLATKERFGLGAVEHDDDFMAVLENGPWLWQENEFFENSGFFDWCDYVENAVGVEDPSQLPGPEGVGLEAALAGYANWTRNIWLPGSCASYGYFTGEDNLECYDTYNASNPMFTDTSVSNTVDRQWNWLLCNQPFGYWQDGAPSDEQTLVSRLVNAEYWIRQCSLFFPQGPDGQTYGIAKGNTEAEVNKWTGGWDITNTTRLIYTNGQFDPWRETTVSSDFRPDGPLQSSEQVPVFIVPGGVHCSDLLTANGAANSGCQAVMDAEMEQIATWVSEFDSS